MRVLVTGAAGFIGSHLVERLLAEGHEVVGIDSFTDYYARELKEGNLAAARSRPGFTFVEADLLTEALEPIIGGTGVVYHLAGQPGVRSSFAKFGTYVERNLLVTHRLLEAARGATSLKAFVFASSSSVYGEVPIPMREDGPLRPASPYGITKLACEGLMRQYAAEFGVPTTSFRFFTVYGERQRPDMAFTGLAVAVLTGREFTVYGTGEQERSFTEVRDVVDVLVAAGKRAPGGVFNVGGGERVSLNGTIAVLERLSGRKARCRRLPSAPGDIKRTEASIDALRDAFGFVPRIRLEDGLRRQLAWVERHLDVLDSPRA